MALGLPVAALVPVTCSLCNTVCLWDRWCRDRETKPDTSKHREERCKVCSRREQLSIPSAVDPLTCGEPDATSHLGCLSGGKGRLSHGHRGCEERSRVRRTEYNVES